MSFGLDNYPGSILVIIGGTLIYARTCKIILNNAYLPRTRYRGFCITKFIQEFSAVRVIAYSTADE
jgi:hypothetical protein